MAKKYGRFYKRAPQLAIWYIWGIWRDYSHCVTAVHPLPFTPRGALCTITKSRLCHIRPSRRLRQTFGSTERKCMSEVSDSEGKKKKTL